MEKHAVQFEDETFLQHRTINGWPKLGTQTTVHFYVVDFEQIAYMILSIRFLMQIKFYDIGVWKSWFEKKCSSQKKKCQIYATKINLKSCKFWKDSDENAGRILKIIEGMWWVSWEESDENSGRIVQKIMREFWWVS